MRVVTMAILVAVGAAAVTFRGLAPRELRKRRRLLRRQRNRPGSHSICRTFHPAPWEWSRSGLQPFRGLPGMKSHFDKLSAELAEKLPIGLLPKLESIEQAAFEFKVSPRDRSKNIQGRIGTGDWMIRSVENFDWKVPIKMLVKPGKTPGELVEVRVEQQIYYRATGSAIFGPGVLFYFPDGRTVVCSHDENNLRRRIQHGALERPEFLRGRDWPQVDRGLIAVAIDNHQHGGKWDAWTDARTSFQSPC